MTDATVEQQGESNRRREHPEVPQAADSSSSSSSESSTDTEMGLVDVCTILSGISAKPIAEPDAENWLRTRPSSLVERTRNVHGGFCTWHSSASCTKRNCTGSVFLSLSLSLQTVGNSRQVVDFMNRFPDPFQTVTDRSLFGPNVRLGMNTLTRWLTRCAAQTLSSLTHSSTVRHTIMSAMSQQLQSDLRVAGTLDPLQHRPPLPMLDILAVDAGWRIA